MKPVLTSDSPGEEDGYSEIVAAAPSEGEGADEGSKGADGRIELRYDAYDEAEKHMILQGDYTVDSERVGELGMDFMAKVTVLDVHKERVCMHITERHNSLSTPSTAELK